MNAPMLTAPNLFGVRTLTGAAWIAIRAAWIAKMGLAPESTAVGDRYDGISWNYIVDEFELPPELKTCSAERLLEWHAGIAPEFVPCD